MEPLPRGDYLDRLIADMRGKLRKRMYKDCEGFRIEASANYAERENSRLEFTSRRTMISIRVNPNYLRHPISVGSVSLLAFIAGVVAGTEEVEIDLSEDTFMIYTSSDPYQVTILSVGQGPEGGHDTNVIHELPLCNQLIDALRALVRV